MAEVKLNTNKKISQEEIRKHKDFNQFIRGYKEFHSFGGMRMLYKKRRLLAIVIVVVVLILILLFDKLG